MALRIQAITSDIINGTAVITITDVLDSHPQVSLVFKIRTPENLTQAEMRREILAGAIAVLEEAIKACSSAKSH